MPRELEPRWGKACSAQCPEAQGRIAEAHGVLPAGGHAFRTPLCRVAIGREVVDGGVHEQGCL